MTITTTLEITTSANTHDASGRHLIWFNYAQRLENYKDMHKKLATSKGVIKPFMACPTLTKARKILFGEKKKVINCSICSHKQCICTPGKKR